MSDYRINVRFHEDVPAERKAAEHLKTLKKSRNKFIVDAVIAYMNNETSDSVLLQNIRQIFREELQAVAVVSTPPTAVTVTPELTEEQEQVNKQIVLADLDMFG
ncbi:MAG: hypothetical protein U0L88_10575 [Acutalibacteraceae bacterium]|nr:hypothetical protein [Acutalibacteraceae bacterium]